MKKESVLDSLTGDQVEKLISTYQNKISSIHRYSSFDYCYNYFQSFYKSNSISQIGAKENLELSVLQLAYYLASWGMMRGSTALLRHSSHALIPVVEFIAYTHEKYWDINIDNYDSRINDLGYLYTEIGRLIDIPLIKDGKDKAQEATTVLITKILLGVYGNTPAMDDFFMKGIGKSNFTNSNYLNSFKKVKNIWNDLSNFYKKHKPLFDSKSIPSLQFDRKDSITMYPKAKLIDMLFFEKGNEIIKQEKELKKSKYA